MNNYLAEPMVDMYVCSPASIAALLHPPAPWAYLAFPSMNYVRCPRPIEVRVSMLHRQPTLTQRATPRDSPFLSSSFAWVTPLNFLITSPSPYLAPRWQLTN